MSAARHLRVVPDEPQAPERADLACEIGNLIRAARWCHRRGTGNDVGVCVPRPRRSVFGLPVEPGLFPIAEPVGKLTAEDLRAIADHHDDVANELRDDACVIRRVADQLARGGLLAAELANMGREYDERRASFRASWDTAYGAGGVYEWDAISSQTQGALFHAGILTVDQARAAVRDGAIYDVSGIGKRRLAELLKALREGQA
jgi:hypothetical protein